MSQKMSKRSSRVEEEVAEIVVDGVTIPPATSFQAMTDEEFDHFIVITNHIITRNKYLHNRDRIPNSNDEIEKPILRRLIDEYKAHEKTLYKAYKQRQKDRQEKRRQEEHAKREAELDRQEDMWRKGKGKCPHRHTTEITEKTKNYWGHDCWKTRCELCGKIESHVESTSPYG